MLVHEFIATYVTTIERRLATLFLLPMPNTCKYDTITLVITTASIVVWLNPHYIDTYVL